MVHEAWVRLQFVGAQVAHAERRSRAFSGTGLTRCILKNRFGDVVTLVPARGVAGGNRLVRVIETLATSERGDDEDHEALAA